jgi:hypothetical protein
MTLQKWSISPYLYIIFMMITFDILAFLFVYYAVCMVKSDENFLVDYFRKTGKCVIITEITDMKRTDVYLKCFLYDTHLKNELL